MAEQPGSSPQTHSLSWPEGSHTGWGEALLGVLSCWPRSPPSSTCSAQAHGALHHRLEARGPGGATSLILTSQLNQTKLWGEPGQICGNNPTYGALVPWKKITES